MAVQHSSLTGSSLHEPKYIDSAGTSDAGKVITPSGTTAGTGELRKLTESEINSKTEYLALTFPDIGTAGSIYFVAPFAGTITKAWSVIHQAIATTDTLLTIEIDGIAVSSSTITIAFSGSAAGNVDSCTPSALNAFTEGQVIEIISDGATTTTPAIATITLKLSRT